MTKVTWGRLRFVLIGIAAAIMVRKMPPSVLAGLKFTVGMKLSLALWLVFSIYWRFSAEDSAPTKTSESVWSRRLHLILVNGAVLLLVLPAPGLTRRFLPTSHFLVAAALIVQAAFVLMAVWARRNLGSNWSGEVRVAKEHQLVRSGPYRFIRHPIYTAALGMYCATALISGEVHAPIALVIVMLAYWRKVRLEERALAGAFGTDFDAYRRNTWALVPLLF